MVGAYHKGSAGQVAPPIAKAFKDGKHLVVGCTVSLLGGGKLMRKELDGMEGSVCGVLL